MRTGTTVIPVRIVNQGDRPNLLSVEPWPCWALLGLDGIATLMQTLKATSLLPEDPRQRALAEEPVQGPHGVQGDHKYQGVLAGEHSTGPPFLNSGAKLVPFTWNKKGYLGSWIIWLLNIPGAHLDNSNTATFYSTVGGFSPHLNCLMYIQLNTVH